MNNWIIGNSNDCVNIWDTQKSSKDAIFYEFLLLISKLFNFCYGHRRIVICEEWN